VPSYLFQASNPQGAVTNGKIEARSLVEAREALKGRGLFNIQFLQSYIYQATNPTGRPITSEVEAENLDEAEKILVTAGYTKIKFFDSENIGAIREMTIAGSSDGESARRRPTPRQMMGSMARRTLRHKVLWAIGRHLVYLGPLLLWNVVALLHQPLTRLDMFGFACTAIYIPWMILKIVPMVSYHQILDANIWQDWKRMRRYIALARRVRKIMKVGIPEYDLKIREASALASEGKLDEALALMEVVRRNLVKDEAIYLVRLATVYMHAKQYDKQHECMVAALEAGPKRSLEWVDYGTHLARRSRDLAGARSAMVNARQFRMAELVKNAGIKCDGMIALGEKDYARAYSELKTGVEGLSKTATTPIGEYLTTEAKAFLAIAAARLGRKDEAMDLWNEVGPLMIARDDRYIIDDYESAIASIKGLN